MPNTRSIYRRRRRPSPVKTPQDIASEYERGHAAPFSPRTPETSRPDSPAVVETRRRDESSNEPDRRRGTARTDKPRR